MRHTCHAHGCEAAVPPSMIFCRSHWFSLRKPMRDAIWREYRSGQERDKNPSLRYLAVQQRSVGEVAFRPNDEAAAVAAAPYLLNAQRLRLLCMEKGLGDPLDGLAPMLEGPAYEVASYVVQQHATKTAKEAKEDE